MTDQEVMDQFIRIAEFKGYLYFIVTKIEWPGPSEPRSFPEIVSRLEIPSDGDPISKEQLRISELKKYFRRCEDCRELNPVGWMHDSRICQHCATQNHGVMY